MAVEFGTITPSLTQATYRGNLHLQAIDPILNGVGMIGLLVTGLSLSGLFKRKVYGV